MQKTYDVWKEKPELIKNFLSITNDYQQLCTEIEYILKKRISERAIEIASISSRAKTLNSFLEKIQRKKYNNPLDEIKDFAGVRVVCLYATDVEKINEIIESEFDIQEEIDKKKNLKIDQFGYGAHHFIVQLGKLSSGSRYDDLREMQCEIQVRTIVQDAWSIIQHHMVYKKESEIPSNLQRKLNCLSALFETVDDQFENIRRDRDSYIQSMRESIHNKNEFLENELNIETFKEYLKWKFPNMPMENWDGQASIVFEGLVTANLTKLIDVENLLISTEQQRKMLKSDLISEINEICDNNIPSNIEPALAISITSKKSQKVISWPKEWIDKINEYFIKQNKID